MENISYYQSFSSKGVKRMLATMRFVIFFLFVTQFQLIAKESTYAASATISIQAEQMLLTDLFSQIEKQTEFLFFYVDKDVANIKVNVKAQDQKIDEVLAQALAKTDLIYTINDRNVNIINKTYAKQQQSKTITGKVIDQNGDPVVGANVIEKGTTNGSITDQDGRFTLSVSPGASLLISYIGYNTQEIVIGNKSDFTIHLTEDTQSIEEVVVIGYGTARKADLTGSTTSLKGERLSNRNSPQLSTQLQGQMAGVQITRSSGDPAAGASIRIRGVTTMSTNDPLVIIDGVPGSLNDVASEDVKDIQVLKDAAAAAIYGSRAAAGVILVTTKRAKTNEFKLSYNFEYSFDKPTAVPRFLGTKDWMAGLNEVNMNDSGVADYNVYDKETIDNFDQLHLQDPDTYIDSDWMGAVFKDHTTHQNHSVSVSGGTDKLKTNFSLNYYSSEGLYENKDYERLNVRMNNDWKINNWIHVNADVNVAYSSAHTPTFGAYTATERGPIWPIYWSDGRLAPGKDGDNTLAGILNGGLNTQRNYRVSGKLQADFTPIEGLTITAIAAPKYTFYKGKSHSKKHEMERLDGSTVTGYGHGSTDLSETRNDTNAMTVQLYANYQKQIKQHSFSVMAGYEDYLYNWENLGASRTNYTLNNFPYLNLGPADMQFNSGTAGHNSYRSVFGRIMYSFNNKYMLQANIRSDASSRFADGYRWGTFPSVSAGWVISEEKWFNKKTIDFLKLRASYGQLGNERIGSEFPYAAALEFSNSLIPNTGGSVDVQQTAFQKTYAFKDITWETTTTYGVGADLRMLQNRLSVSADWYYKETKDMLLTIGFPSYFGYNAPENNAADMHTKGWDLEIGWNDNIGTDFRYGVSVNLSDYRSKMGYMADRQSISSGKITEEGSYYQEWYGFKSKGIILNEAAMYDENGDKIPVYTAKDKPGCIAYVDIDGDGKITESDDRVYLGNSLPEYLYGGNLWAEWKNFDFNLSFQGVGHQLKRFNFCGTAWANSAYSAETERYENRWSVHFTDEQNAKAKYPMLTTANTTNTNAHSDFWLFNGGYFRVKNITLGYTIPKAITEKAYIQRLRVYLSLNDLPAISNYPKGYDPEWSNYNEFITTSYVLGVNVSF